MSGKAIVSAEILKNNFWSKIMWKLWQKNLFQTNPCHQVTLCGVYLT